MADAKMVAERTVDEKLQHVCSTIEVVLNKRLDEMANEIKGNLEASQQAVNELIDTTNENLAQSLTTLENLEKQVNIGGKNITNNVEKQIQEYQAKLKQMEEQINLMNQQKPRTHAN